VASQRLEDAVREAHKALGRLRLENNPVSPETMVKASHLIGELRSGTGDLESLRSEVLAALAPAPTSVPKTAAA
jgi:hypothetical protein